MTTSPVHDTERHEFEARCLEREMAFARRIARRYTGRGVATDDLEQVAYLGLLKAIRGFDPERGDSFHNYASVTIRGELRRHFRDCGWMVRPPRALQELQPRVWAAESRLTRSLGRSPTLAELADEVGVPRQRVAEAQCLPGCFTPSSLDAPSQPETGTLSETLGSIDEGYELADMRATLAHCRLRLSPRDRRIIELRFVRGRTQKQIGDEIGVTQMQVSRLLSRVIRDLRTAVEAG